MALGDGGQDRVVVAARRRAGSVFALAQSSQFAEHLPGDAIRRAAFELRVSGSDRTPFRRKTWCASSNSPPQRRDQGLGTRIHAHFARLGGVELELTEPSSSPTL